AEVAQLRATAKMIMAEARTAHPNDIERELDELDILLKLEDYKTAAPLVDILEAKLLLRPEMTKWVLQVVSAMPVVSAPNGATAVTPAENPGVFRAVTLLEAAQKIRPKDLGIKVALGRVMRVQGKVDEALALFDEARKIETSAKPLEVFRQEDFR